MRSFFGFRKSKTKNKHGFENSNSSEDEKGIIGKYHENGLPVIVKFINELPDAKIISKYPTLTVVSWKYDGEENNGIPVKKVNKKMIVLEEALGNAMDSSKLYQHAYSRTGNNLKEFVYYSTNQDDFMKVLNNALVEHERYPIEINFYEDHQWSEFRKLIDDFKKEN